MELLKRRLEEEFIKNGNTQEVIKMSQELDILVAKEQRKRLDIHKKVS